MTVPDDAGDCIDSMLDENAALRTRVAELEREAAETRVVLRQFYGRDEPISSADIARRMLARIDDLEREAAAARQGRDEAVHLLKVYDHEIAHAVLARLRAEQENDREAELAAARDVVDEAAWFRSGFKSADLDRALAAYEAVTGKVVEPGVRRRIPPPSEGA